MPPRRDSALNGPTADDRVDCGRLLLYPQLAEKLDRLLATGLFGHTRTEFIRLSVEERVRRLIKDGWLEREG